MLREVKKSAFPTYDEKNETILERMEGPVRIPACLLVGGGG
jgi:hypothetical protein